MNSPIGKTERISVMFVDDEPINLSTFKAAFREFYTIHLAKSADEALKILKENKIHVIFADQRMPTTTGIQFFESILDEYPDSIRVLLTGYADVEAVIEAINRGQVYRYIKKPWNEIEIKMTAEKGYELYNIRQQLNDKMYLLEKTNHELNRFVYSASHELRAPLMS
ncbi:MAG: response regulator, partial [Cytophagales bacterium]|nr:response regulator [Cytophagales bacterium]